jgi:hypothetical protein
MYMTRNAHINVALRHVHVTISAVEKQLVLHILSLSIVFVIQHAMRIRRIILSSVACLSAPYYSTLSHTARFSGKLY